MCFVWISEQTAIISLYSINWLVFYNWDGVCLLRGTDWVFMCNSRQFYPCRVNWASTCNSCTTLLLWMFVAGCGAVWRYSCHCTRHESMWTDWKYISTHSLLRQWMVGGQPQRSVVSPNSITPSPIPVDRSLGAAVAGIRTTVPRLSNLYPSHHTSWAVSTPVC